MCTYRLNWAGRTSWEWWNKWDDTALQTHDLKFERCRSEAEHTTFRSRRLPTIFNRHELAEKKHFASLKSGGHSGGRTCDLQLSKQAALTTVYQSLSAETTQSVRMTYSKLDDRQLSGMVTGDSGHSPMDSCGRAQPETTKQAPNAGLMLHQRRRRCPNISVALCYSWHQRFLLWRVNPFSAGIDFRRQNHRRRSDY